MNPARKRANSAVGRRSLLEWLGGASVLALTSPLIEACRLEAIESPLGVGGLPDAGTDGHTGPGKDAAADAYAEAGKDATVDGYADAGNDAAACGYEPGTLTRPDLVNWNVRSIDPQDLAAILAGWSFSIDGLVNKPLKAGFCDLRDMGLVHQVTDFHCVEGWSVYDVPWDGILLSALLDQVGVLPSATYLKIHSFGDKYFEQLPIAVAREPKSILAIGVEGATLPLAHGFPARVVVPRLLGYKNPKFVNRIELVDTVPGGYWEQYGYTLEGEVPPERLRPGKY
ncbi:MAG: molybdopterin-dependent oxidoreductase [Deltaproteobacteria bacterium]|nr:molybdopterin-dependent oxidoreductase [Deltaproteobacteria bacterium]